MNSILLYIVQSSISLIIFYVFYELLFKREAYLGFNRYYLLLAIFISSALPLIEFNFYQIFSVGSDGALLAAPVYSIVEYSLAEVTIYSNGIQSTNSVFSGGSLSLLQIIILIYFTGVVIKATHFAWRLFQLLRIFRQSKVHELDGLYFIFTEPGTPVFSFFNYVFIDKEMYNSYDEIEKIIEHEKIHVRQKHSVDLIIAEILTIIQWFNPLAYMLKKTLKENHEFIADNDVLSTFPDAMAYRKLLIENSSIIKTNILTHNFSYSLLKRRLFMIRKTKNPQLFSLKLVWVVLALNMVFFACSGPMQKDDSLSEIEFYENSATIIHQDSISLQTLTYPDDGYVVFLVSLGKERAAQLDLFDENDMLIKSYFGGNWGPGTYGATWRPNDGEAIPVGNYSYRLIADDMEITGTFSYKTNNVVEAEIFTVVEQMPEYPGGMKALVTYLSENIQYPQEAKDKGIQGRVFINFVLDTDGSVTNAKLLRGIGGGCDEEAIRVVSAMPNWKPGMQRDTPVRVSYNLPIKFALSEKSSDTVFIVVEEMPEFPGGRKQLMSYLGKNIIYPEAAKNDEVSGRVFITFVIEKDGSVNEVKLLRGIGSGCDEEAIRVVSSMPKWKPGLADGNPVRVQYNLPIKFQLQ